MLVVSIPLCVVSVLHLRLIMHNMTTQEYRKNNFTFSNPIYDQGVWKNLANEFSFHPSLLAATVVDSSMRPDVFKGSKRSPL